MGTPHGFGDDERTRLLRRRPSAQALSWAEAAIGARVTGVRACKGGSSSAIHALRVASEAGADTVILRAYVIADVVSEEPDIVDREAAALGLLERTAVPTPGLLAADPTGDGAGVPSVLMTRLPGRVDWTPADMNRWLHDLAAVLPVLHETPVDDDDGVRDFFPYAPSSWAPPVWLRRPDVWERAVEVFHRPPLDRDRVLIHRDYHPGNVLWRRGRVSGVVDWQAVSRGPRAVDVFWCRANLIERFGMEIGDRFVEVWERVSGASYHPWAEAVMLVDFLGWSRHSREPRFGLDLEDLLDRRLSELGV
jgi:aminoglycoside phosphotransferase (APT) family kinase protein